MTATPKQFVLPLVLCLTAPLAAADGAPLLQERSRPDQQNQQNQQDPAKPRQQPRQQPQPQPQPQQRQGQGQPDANRQQPERPPQPAPEATPEQNEQRKANARQQQQAEQDQLEKRKANARAQQQQELQRQQQQRQQEPGAAPAGQRAAVNQWAQEMRQHRSRVARIERLKQLAISGNDRERVTQLDQLLARETNRHDTKLARIEGAMDPTVLRQLEARVSKVKPAGKGAPARGGARGGDADTDERPTREGGAQTPREDADSKSDASPSRPR